MNKLSPVVVFEDIFDGYSAHELASDLSTPETLFANTNVVQKAFDATRAESPTEEQQKDAHTALVLLLDGEDEDDLVTSHGIDSSFAGDYMNVVNSTFDLPSDNK